VSAIRVLSTAAFFAGEPAVLTDRVRAVLVDEDDTIRVQDETAGYYTTVHSLSAEETARVLELARKHRQKRAARGALS